MTGGTPTPPATATAAVASTSTTSGGAQADLLGIHRRLLLEEQRGDQGRREGIFIDSTGQVLPPPKGAGAAGPAVLELAHRERRGCTVALHAQAPRQPVELVPIRLDIDMDGYKIRDTLLWNLNEESLTVEEFAEITCRDFDVPVSSVGQAMVKGMREQLQEHREAVGMLRNAGGVAALRGIRAKVRLDVTVGMVQLRDQLEWDLSESIEAVRAFAETYVREFGWSREFMVTIANDIYEQVFQIRRALLLVGFAREADGSVRVNDAEIQQLICPPIPADGRRPPASLAEFTANITELEAEDLERIELSRDRDARRKRRQKGGGGRRQGEVTMAGWTSVSAPKTMLTPLTYRGSIHRVLNMMDDEDAVDAPGFKGGFASKGARTRRRR